MLIVTGFIVVALATAGSIVEIDHAADTYSGYAIFFWVAYTVGYGLLAWATWTWFTALDGDPTSGFRLAGALKLFAIANLAFAIGLVSLTYYWAHQAISGPYDGRLSTWIPTIDGRQLVGFCLVSAGFWSAASVVRAVSRRDPIPAESTDVGAAI